MRRVTSQAIRANDREGGPTLKEFWKRYNIWTAMNNTGDSWAQIKESTMPGCWKRLCPDLVQNFKGFEENAEDATKQVVHLMNELNLGVSIEDVDELIASYLEQMLNEELTDIQEENKTQPEAKDDDCHSPPTKNLTVKEMKEAFDHLQ
jgi:hypothetical protein